MTFNFNTNSITPNSETGGGGGGTTNYNDLTNKPQINGITLIGNKTSEELGITGGGTNFFSFEVDENGDLIMSYIDDTPPNIYIEGTDLIMEIL